MSEESTSENHGPEEAIYNCWNKHLSTFTVVAYNKQHAVLLFNQQLKELGCSPDVKISPDEIVGNNRQELISKLIHNA